MPAIYKRNCDYCGAYYEKAGAKRFCSIQCVGKYNSERPRYPNEPTREELHALYTTEQLGVYQIAKRLNIPASAIHRRMRRFGIQLRPQTLAQKVAVEQGRKKTGSAHWNWKGGRKYRKNGYNALLRPGHPRAGKDGYVQEHTIVWEETHGKNLPDGWVVHHINGVKNDNRPENLLGMPKSKHDSHLVTRTLQARIRELEALLAKRQEK